MDSLSKEFFQSPNAVFDNPGLGMRCHEKLVYLYLSRCSNQGADAFPGYGKIAKKCSIGRSTAIRAVRGLKEKNFISVKPRPNKSNLYIVKELPSVTGTLDLVSQGHQPSVTGTPYKEPVKKNYIKKTPISPLKETELFNSFWKEYPKKISKVVAEKAFHKHNPTPELLEKMLLSIQEQKKSDQWLRDGGQFIPHPTTWLNQKRWEDEVVIVQEEPKEDRSGAAYRKAMGGEE